MQKIEIDINEPLNPGDVVELHFKTVGLTWLQAVQIATIESLLKDNKQFEILSWSIVGDTGIIFTCRVKATNPVIVTVAVIAAAIAGVGVVAWLTLDKAYQIIESPASNLAFSSIGLVGIAVLAGFILNALKK